jgi:hypothetical protein
LSGAKEVFANHEIRPINVPRFKGLSLKTVYEFARNHPRMQKYLPDMQDDDEPTLDREFLFTVVNTCDGHYFPQQLRRIEAERQEAAEKLR